MNKLLISLIIGIFFLFIFNSYALAQCNWSRINCQNGCCWDEQGCEPSSGDYYWSTLDGWVRVNWRGACDSDCFQSASITACEGYGIVTLGCQCPDNQHCDGGNCVPDIEPDPTSTPTPPITNTPTPTCPVAVAPVPNTQVCSGNQVTLSWSTVPDTSYYALRLDNHINGWLGTCDPINPGDLCADTVNSSYPTTITQGDTYGWWVQSINSCGNWSAGAGGTFSCPANTPTPTPVPSYCTATNTVVTGCYSSFPIIYSNFGGGADQLQFAVDTDSGFVDPWSCNSGWLVGFPLSYSCTLGTGNYYWTARASSTTGSCVTSPLSPAYPVSVDQTSPNIPSGLTLACSADYTASASWTPATDVGCKGLNSSPYWTQLSTDPTFATAYSDMFWDNSWTTSYMKSTNFGVFNPGQTLYARVRSRDGFNNQSSWSANVSTVCPTLIPTATPTITPTPLPCTVSRSLTNGCFGPTSPIAPAPPVFHATYGGNQVQYAASLNNNFGATPAWTCNSGWINLTSYTCPWGNFTTNPTTAPYYWSARSRSTSTPQTCSQSSLTVPTPIAFSVDKTAPTTPVAPVLVRSGSTINASWTASNDDGCLDCGFNPLGLSYACKYWIRGYFQGPTPASGSTPTPVHTDIDNGEWTPGNVAAPAYSTSCSGYDGLYYVFNVRQAKDGYAVAGNVNSDNESDLNTTRQSIQCPTPSAYPTINITGTLQQKSNTYCYQANAGKTFAGVTIAVSPPANSCTTPAPVCSIVSSSSEAWAYSCNISFNNQSCFAPTPSGTLNLFARASSSGSGVWGPTPAGTTCSSPTSSTIGYDLSGSTQLVKDVIFSTTTDSWVKLKSSSYWTSSPPKTNYLPPAIVNPYDSDDNSEKYFIIGGSVPTAGADAGVASGMTVCGTDDCYSTPHDWHDEGKSYQANYGFTPSQYLEYLKSMKEYKTISNFSEIDSANKIYLIKGNQTISVADFGKDKIVIIVANSAGTSLGTVIINGSGNAFNNTANNYSLAIIADQIIFSDSLTEAKGIFIANTIDTGSNSSQGLKINGNLVATSIFTNNRGRSDTSKPTIFIISNFKMYMDLLPYLSKSIYDWRQLQ